MVALADRYGPTVPLALIVHRLRRTVCGARLEITIGVEGEEVILLRDERRGKGCGE